MKDQIREYLAWADEKMAAGAAETDLTLFSTVELHIFQTYYGGLRLNAEKTEWIYNDFELVEQMCSEIYDTKAWLIDQGALFDNTVAPTLIGCLWQRINRFQGGVVNGEEVPGKWGTYFATTKNTLLSANEKNQIMLRTTATELMTDETGRVVGVKAEQYDGTPVEITANAVILATGGYAANIDMVLETNDYWSEDDVTASILTTNRSCATGDGIVMGRAAGRLPSPVWASPSSCPSAGPTPACWPAATAKTLSSSAPLAPKTPASATWMRAPSATSSLRALTTSAASTACSSSS